MTADSHPLDPISQALGRLDGRLDEFEKRMDDRFAAVDHRFDDFEHRMADRFAQIDQRFDRLDRRLSGLYALLTLGLTIIGWLVTRTH